MSKVEARNFVRVQWAFWVLDELSNGLARGWEVTVGDFRVGKQGRAAGMSVRVRVEHGERVLTAQRVLSSVIREDERYVRYEARMLEQEIVKTLEGV